MKINILQDRIEIRRNGFTLTAVFSLDALRITSVFTRAPLPVFTDLVDTLFYAVERTVIRRISFITTAEETAAIMGILPPTWRIVETVPQDDGGQFWTVARD
jgi:hypothetical protein